MIRKKKIFKIIFVVVLISVFLYLGACFLRYFGNNVFMSCIKSGYIDKTGKEVIPLKYSRVGYFNNGLAVVSNKRGLYGMIDKTGKVVVPLKYYSLSAFKNGYAAASKKRGYIAHSIKYKTYIEVLLKERNPFNVEVDSAVGVIDRNGKEIIPFKYSSIIPCGNDIFLASIMNKGDLESFYIDKNGKRLFKSYDTINPFFNGYAIVNSKYKKTLDENGNLKLTRDYTKTYHRFSSDLDNYYSNIIDTNGKELLPIKYSNIGYVCDGLAYVEKREIKNKKEPNNGFYFVVSSGFIDFKTGKEIISCEYDTVPYDFYHGTDSDKYFFILEDKDLCPSISEILVKEGYIVMSKGDKNFLVARNGKALPLNYYGVGNYVEGLVSAGKILKDSKYEYIPDKGNRKYFDTYKEAYTYINKVENRYYDIKPTKVKYGYVNSAGKEVIPFVYDMASDFINGEAFVKQGKRNFCIDKKGKFLRNDDRYENKKTEKYLKKGEYREGLMPVVKFTLLGKLLDKIF